MAIWFDSQFGKAFQPRKVSPMGKSMEFVRRISWGLVWCGCVVWMNEAMAQEDAEVNAATEPRVVYLHTEYLPYTPKQDDVMPYHCGREIMRQAVLIAAPTNLAARHATRRCSRPCQHRPTCFTC